MGYNYNPVLFLMVCRLSPLQTCEVELLYFENDWHLLANWEWTTHVAPLKASRPHEQLSHPPSPNGRCSSTRSQSRLRYIADRVLQSSSDMFQKNKDEAWHLPLWYISWSLMFAKQMILGNSMNWTHFPLWKSSWNSQSWQWSILAEHDDHGWGFWGTLRDSTKCCNQCFYLVIGWWFNGDFLGNLWIELKMFAPVLVLVVVCIIMFDHPHCWCCLFAWGPTVGTLKSGRLIQKHMPHLKNENYKQLVMLVKQ